MKSKIKVFLYLLPVFFLAACGGGGGGSSGDGGGDGSGPKLLSRVLQDGNVVVSLRYDNLNRVTEYMVDDGFAKSIKTIEYTGGDLRPSLVRNEGAAALYPYTQYSYGEASYRGAITKFYQTQDLNSNRIPVFQGVFIRHYLNSLDRVFAIGVPGAGDFAELFSYDSRGNLTKVTATHEGWGNDETWEFTYDDRKGAISETATPYWWFAGTLGPNNLTGITYTKRSSGVVINRAHRTINCTYDSDGYPTRCTGSGDTILGAYGTIEGTFEYISAH